MILFGIYGRLLKFRGDTLKELIEEWSLQVHIGIRMKKKKKSKNLITSLFYIMCFCTYRVNVQMFGPFPCGCVAVGVQRTFDSFK
jgi:hypothetical protein